MTSSWREYLPRRMYLDPSVDLHLLEIRIVVLNAD